MQEREQQFLKLYQKHRFEDQRRYYEARSAEYEAARTQAINLHTSLMVLAAISAAFAALDLFDRRLVWSVLAAVLPVLATVVTAYDGLFAFERQAKLFGDALNALGLVHARAPEPDGDGAELDPAAISAYVAQIEAVLRREQAQWGQLISEVKLADVPSTDK